MFWDVFYVNGMKDFDLMPFGTHKGKTIAHVPDSYLRDLWDIHGYAYKHSQLRGDKFEVIKYIDERFEDLP